MADRYGSVSLCRYQDKTIASQKRIGLRCGIQTQAGVISLL
jgi:hypothetical protein